MKTLNITIGLSSIAELDAVLEGLDLFVDLNTSALDPKHGNTDMSMAERKTLTEQVQAASQLRKNIRGFGGER